MPDATFHVSILNVRCENLSCESATRSRNPYLKVGSHVIRDNNITTVLRIHTLPAGACDASSHPLLRSLPWYAQLNFDNLVTHTSA